MTALETLTAKIENLRGQAEKLRNAYQTSIQNINDDPNLSAAGRLASLQNVQRPDDKMQSLLAQEQDALTSTADQLVRKLGGTPGPSAQDIIAWRDAQDRAAQVTDPAEAQDAMTTALTRGDTQLAQAHLHQAMNQGFNGAMEAYVAANPDATQDVNDLHAIRRYQNDRQFKFGQAIAYHLGQSPV